jgi:hypothetical protein
MKKNQNAKTALQYVDISKMGKDSTDALAVFGGIIAGKFAEKQLDKVFTSTTVQGLVGIEVAEATAKYLKPAIIAAGGIFLHQIGKGMKNDIVKMGGLGVAVVGLVDITSAIMNKPILSGFGDVNGDEYQVIDIESGAPLEGGAMLQLPDLDTSEPDEISGFGSFQEGEYEDFEIAS